MNVGIITASDKGFRGERTDESGAHIKERILELKGQIIAYEIVPDEQKSIEDKLIEMSDRADIHLILTTGGTGLTPRDVTPEATLAVIEKQVPGIPEAMRAKSLEITNRAMLSRSMAGIRNATLIVNLPGSKKAVSECLDVILPVMGHALDLLKGDGTDCGRK